LGETGYHQIKTPDTERSRRTRNCGQDNGKNPDLKKSSLIADPSL